MKFSSSLNPPLPHFKFFLLFYLKNKNKNKNKQNYGSSTTILVSSTPMPRRSGRVVVQPDQFMYLGESFEAILEEHEINLTDYDEAMCNVDAHL